MPGDSSLTGSWPCNVVKNAGLVGHLGPTCQGHPTPQAAAAAAGEFGLNCNVTAAVAQPHTRQTDRPTDRPAHIPHPPGPAAAAHPSQQATRPHFAPVLISSYFLVRRSMIFYAPTTYYYTTTT
jgi:hypothetical protein